MDAAFFFLIWIASPSGGHSDFFGARADCERAKAEVDAARDTLYSSECIEAKMLFRKGVRQEYQRPTEVIGRPE